MDWRNAAAAFPPLEEKDIAHLQLSKEENEQVLTLFNRAVSNAQSDSADIAMIALKKLLTKYPAWGDAALLYGICLALDGKFKRAGASFEHAVSAGLLTEELTYLAQVCYRDAGVEYAQERRHFQSEEEAESKKILATFFPAKKNRGSVFREIDTEERGHMQAPILTRVPRNNGKAKLASDRERRDVMMQSNSPNSDKMDEEIDVSIPKTPAEKLRILIIALAGVLLAVLLGLAIWFLIIPAVSSYQENSGDAAKLKYLLAEMQTQKADPEISRILSDYVLKFPPDAAAGQNTKTGTQSSTTTSQNTSSVPVQGVSPTITPSVAPAGPTGSQGDATTAPGADATAAVSPTPASN